VSLLPNIARTLPAGLLGAAVAAGVWAQAARTVSQQVASKFQDPLAQANAALQAGEADKALALLQPLATSGAGQAGALNLECRVHFTLQQWDAAIKECEEAVRLDGQNSDYHLWLGRALGEKADRASFLSAYSLAKRVRLEFEEAVRLNPRNGDALADLGEFYKDAPGVVGGGTDKAAGIAAQLDKVDAGRAHELRGRIADGGKDYGTAEREFKQAVAASAHPATEWVTLAGFYRERGRWADMDSAVHSIIAAAQRDKHASVALYDGASELTGANRDLALAAKMLEDYLAGESKTEDAPAFIALNRLAKLKDQLGDPAAASQERAQALALAREFKPDRDGKH
jgi:tetratricopeptide (TPR) repeat protein